MADTTICGTCGGTGDVMEDNGTPEHPRYELETCPDCGGRGHCPPGGWLPRRRNPNGIDINAMVQRMLDDDERRRQEWKTLTPMEKQIRINQIRAKHAKRKQSLAT